MIVHVGGDGSHLALVDTASYTSFVGRNWAKATYFANTLSNRPTACTSLPGALALKRIGESKSAQALHSSATSGNFLGTSRVPPAHCISLTTTV